MPNATPFSLRDQTQSALTSRVAELEEQLAVAQAQLRDRPRLGLVWEDRPETVETQMESELPVLEEVPKLAVKSETPDNRAHLLIEGDNLHALAALTYTHHRSIDVIYIDPPYNTGSRDFRYNDSFVGTEDEWRHSKWLSFMNRRLVLASELLSPTGFIFISIDDNEAAQLRLLCDRVFGYENFVTAFAWVQSALNVDDMDTNAELATVGANLGDFKSTHEYVLCYRASKHAKLALLPPTSDFIDSRITKAGNTVSQVIIKAGTRCVTADAKFTGIIGGESEALRIVGRRGMVIKNHSLVEDVIVEGPMANPNYIRRYFEGETVQDRRGQVIEEVFLTATGLPYTRKRKAGEISSNVLSGYGDTSVWHRRLKEMVGPSKAKMYPKPTPMIAKLVRLGSSSPDAVVLDFFAGSGTTAHAVAELNATDGGSRQAILVTNNEGGICGDVTYPRLKAAFTGAWYDGARDSLPGSLRYYRCAFVPKTVHRDSQYRRLAARSVDLIAVREGAHTVLCTEPSRWALRAGSGRVVGVWLDPDITDVVKLRDLGDAAAVDLGSECCVLKKVLYFFTLDGVIDAEIVSMFAGWRVEAIPAHLLSALRQRHTRSTS